MNLKFLTIIYLKATTIASDFTIIFIFIHFMYIKKLKFKHNQTYSFRESTTIKWLLSVVNKFGLELTKYWRWCLLYELWFGFYNKIIIWFAQLNIENFTASYIWELISYIYLQLAGYFSKYIWHILIIRIIYVLRKFYS